MNRLSVGRSARSQQAHKVYTRINWLMDLHKTDVGIPANLSYRTRVLLCTRQTSTHTHIHTHTHRHRRIRILVSAQSRLWQTITLIRWRGRYMSGNCPEERCFHLHMRYLERFPPLDWTTTLLLRKNINDRKNYPVVKSCFY